MKIKVILLAILLGLFAQNVISQELEGHLSRYTEANGQLYMQPLADVLGANFNSGLYHTAAIKKNGFQLYIGVSTMAANIPDKLRTFNAKPEGMFTPQGGTNATFEAPTVLGAEDGTTIPGIGGTSYTFPGGLDLNYLPLAVPQVTIGSLMGTNATFRFISYDAGEDIGKIELFGWGVKHSLNQYFENLPVNLAVGFYNQYLKLDDIIDANATLINLQASINKSIVTIYGGVGYETSTLDIEYTYEEGDIEEEISFDLDGPKSLRATIGVTLNLGPIKVNADYNLAEVNVVSAGIGVGIGDK